jgi:hypothetical protein
MITREGELVRVVVPKRQYRDLLDCGHREPGLLAYWRAQDGPQRIAAPLEVTLPKPPAGATASGFRAEVTENDAFARRRG